MGWRVLDLAGSGYEKVASFYEHGKKKKNLAFYNLEGKFLGYLGQILVPKMGYAPLYMLKCAASTLKKGMIL